MKSLNVYTDKKEIKQIMKETLEEFFTQKLGVNT